MNPPCEMMVESFLPAMREKVARRLREEGYSQSRIAALLGVTQAAVSLYLRSEERSRQLLSNLAISEEVGERYAALLAEDLKKNPMYAINTLYSIWADALGRGSLCEAHRAEYPALAGCDMCLRRFGSQSKPGFDAIAQVSAAVAALERSPVFVRVMPEVSVNIAYAVEGASSAQDVVAVPGRIVRVKGTARSFMRPEFGASTHLAGVLLVMSSRDHGMRAAMNLRYDRPMQEAVDALGLRTVSLPVVTTPRTDPEMLKELRQILSESSGRVDAVVDPGGPGIEPELYLFAEDPMKVSRLGLEIARVYVEPARRRP